jgi:hypothetical protein
MMLTTKKSLEACQMTVCCLVLFSVSALLSVCSVMFTSGPFSFLVVYFQNWVNMFV